MPQTTSSQAAWHRAWGPESAQDGLRALARILDGAKDLVRQSEQSLNEGLQATEQVVRHGLQQEHEWLRIWNDSIGDSALAATSRPALEISRQLLEHRSQLWDAWFALHRQISLSPVERLIEQLKPDEELIRGWQDLIQSWFPQLGASQPDSAEPEAAAAAEPAVEASVTAETEGAVAKPRSGRTVAARAATVA